MRTQSRLATGSDAERRWIAKGVDDHVDFRRKAAARPADGLVAPLFVRAPRHGGAPLDLLCGFAALQPLFCGFFHDVPGGAVAFQRGLFNRPNDVGRHHGKKLPAIAQWGP
jgi:hypothetical protein